MKSLVLTGPGNLSLKEAPVPKIGHNDVLIKVEYASICHTDIFTYYGKHPWMKYPGVLGHEMSGVVDDIGTAVTGIKIDDKVAAISYYFCGKCSACQRGENISCDNVRFIPFKIEGGFQEKISLPSSMVYKISDNLDLKIAALAEPTANAFSVIDNADISINDKVLIIGPGPIGLITLQIASLFNPEKLIVTGTRDERLKLAKQFGASDVINIKKIDPYKELMNITEGKGVDVVLLCGGGIEAWGLGVRVLAPFGRILIEALPEDFNEEWQISPFKFIEKGIKIIGVAGYSERQFCDSLRLIESNRINLSPIITHTFKLNDFDKAFRTSEKRLEGALKVMFKIN